MMYSSPHSFHIPVMGLAYTIDSPVKVARFGITSVLSIVEDRLVEMMRKYYSDQFNKPFEPVATSEPDYRAKRITSYLNLVNEIVHEQVEKLRVAAFEKGSEIVKYFEMLPDESRLKKLYQQFVHAQDDNEKLKLENVLRKQIVAGSIDVNLMTKVDKENYNKQGELLEDGSDAVAALRGYVNSDLTHSSIVFSAGMNPRLYNYLEQCPQFDADDDGVFRKKVIIKVSDYRSALIQGKYLAKKGIWVSEFRIESGLNCGGHAFASDGYLMGPILEEFKNHKEELVETLFALYNQTLKQKGKKIFKYAPQVFFSVQGGIGTHAEDEFLKKYYPVTSTGWGTPFLLVPEATTVDEDTLNLLCKARQHDVELSHNSPLGVRFHYLKGTTSHKEKLERIAKGRPGSPCTEKHLAFNTEFTKTPICTASSQYQKLKTAQLQSLNLPKEEYERQISRVHDKECLCIGLSNPAANSYGIPFLKKLEANTICPGPNIAHFTQVVTLPTMIDHIYGRTNIMMDADRPNMFVAELHLYISFISEKIQEDAGKEMNVKERKYYQTFFNNLHAGIAYYRTLPAGAIQGHERFLQDLDEAEEKLLELNPCAKAALA